LFAPISHDAAPEFAVAPARTAVWVYDRRALDPERGGWLSAMRAEPAACRGRLYRNARGALGFVPDPAASPVRGRIVDVDPVQLPVLDFVHAAHGDYRRVPVEAVISLRCVVAETWALVDPFGWKPLARSV
jgi:hypothetical protein